MFRPDDFHGRPYGFTTNQISHATAVGFLGIVYGSCVLSYFVFGELPYKWMIAVGGGIGYAFYEYYAQGWKGWDTVEDWWFVIAYGVCMPLLGFSEIRPGTPEVVFDLIAPLPLVVVFFVHLALGALYRWLQQKGLIE